MFLCKRILSIWRIQNSFLPNAHVDMDFDIKKIGYTLVAYISFKMGNELW